MKKNVNAIALILTAQLDRIQTIKSSTIKWLVRTMQTRVTGKCALAQTMKIILVSNSRVLVKMEPL